MTETNKSKITEPAINNDDESKSLKNGNQNSYKLKPVIFFLVISVVLIFSFFYLYKQITEQNNSANESTSLLVKGTALRIETLEEKIKQQDAKINSLVNSIGDQLQQQQPGNNLDWALAEIEFLLIIANHHLQIEGNVKIAKQSMKTALLRLEDLHAPDIDLVKNQIQSDIDKLDQVDLVDISGLSLYLADLAERSDNLPLKPDKLANDEQGKKPQTTEQSTTGIKAVFSRIWNVIKGMIVIKREDEVSSALLIPSQQYFLKQNLRLQLASARLAVLQRDNENFQSSIKMVRNWLDQYYDGSIPDVINIKETLEQMSSLNLDNKIPDISSSLETVKAYIREH